MSLFSSNSKIAPVQSDPILLDLPRGVENRSWRDATPPHAYFEDPTELSKIGFRDHSADVFFGLVGGKTKIVLRKDGRSECETKGGVAIGLRDDRHLTTVAGSRSGKGRSAIIPNLLSYAGSVLVIDPKGENAAITAEYRSQDLNQNVYVLDPFKITGDTCGEHRKCLNPLSLLDLGGKTLFEDAALIADALVVPSGGTDTHWDESAKALILGVILHVLTWHNFNPKEHNLVTVADLICGKTQPIAGLLKDMGDNEAFKGRVIAAARVLTDMGDRERGSVLSSARKNLRFLQYNAIRENVIGKDFKLADIMSDEIRPNNKRYTTVYLVLPATRLNSCSQWLRIFVNLILKVAEDAPVRPEIPTLMILDEFAALGRMIELERAIAQIAGFGLRIWTILQDMGQLNALYGKSWETFLGNSGALQFFGNVDNFTSDWISKYLDKTTIILSDSSSTTLDQKHMHGASGRSERTHTQELLTPGEVRRFFARDDIYNRQLLLIPGKRPYILQRANYDQHELFDGRYGYWR